MAGCDCATAYATGADNYLPEPPEGLRCRDTLSDTGQDRAYGDIQRVGWHAECRAWSASAILIFPERSGLLTKRPDTPEHLLFNVYGEMSMAKCPCFLH